MTRREIIDAARRSGAATLTATKRFWLIFRTGKEAERFSEALHNERVDHVLTGKEIEVGLHETV